MFLSPSLSHKTLLYCLASLSSIFTKLVTFCCRFYRSNRSPFWRGLESNIDWNSSSLVFAIVLSFFHLILLSLISFFMDFFTSFSFWTTTNILVHVKCVSQAYVIVGRNSSSLPQWLKNLNGLGPPLKLAPR